MPEIVGQHLISLQIATVRDFSISIHFRIVEHILCDIQAHRCIIRSTRILALPVWALRSKTLSMTGFFAEIKREDKQTH